MTENQKRAQGRKRLLELARFLREEVADKLFDYAEVMKIGKKQPKEALKAGGGCGTVGCAMGWGAVRWPKAKLTDKFWPGTLSANNSNVMEFFGISDDEVDFLFYPKTNGNKLDDRATRQQVAAHIEKFVADDIRKQELKTEILRGIKELKKLKFSDDHIDDISDALY